MKQTKAIALIMCLFLAVAMITSCDQNAADNKAQTQTNVGTGVFKVGNNHYPTLQKAVDATVKEAKTKAVPTIVLTGDVSDEGAVIDTDVNLDFGSYSYTLKNSSTGIVIDKVEATATEDEYVPTVSIKGGVFNAATNNAADLALFASEGNLTLSNVSVDLTGTALDAIKATAGETTIEGISSITVEDGKRIVVASGDATKVCVKDDANVSLRGGFNLSGSAQVDLANSELYLTSVIVKADGASITINDDDEEYMPNVNDFFIYEEYVPYQDSQDVVETDTDRLDNSKLIFVNLAPKALEIELRYSAVPTIVYKDNFIVYQWYKATVDGSGSDWTVTDAQPIPGATKSSYTPERSEFTGGEPNYYYCKASNGWTGTPLLTSRVAKVVNTGLPALYISVDDSSIDVTPTDSDGTSYIKNNYVSAKFALVTGDEYQIGTTEITMKGRGNASWTNAPKKGYNLKIGSKPSILGMAGAKKWSIIGNYYDRTLIRNYLSKVLSEEIEGTNEWNPEYQFVDLVLNGEYYGNYAIAEPIQINKNRLNIKSIEDAKSVDDFAKKGGFILEVDFRAQPNGEHPDDYLFYSGIYGVPFAAKDPDIEDIKGTLQEDAVAFMKSKIDAVEAELSATNFMTKTVDEIKTIDVDSFVDWYILEEVAKNLDADFYTSVYVYYNPADGLVHMGPHWDFDKSFGNFSRTKTDTKKVHTSDGFWINKSQSSNWPSWYEILLENPSFYAAVKNRWKEISPRFSMVFARIEEMAAKLSVSAALNFERWNHLLGQDSKSGNEVGELIGSAVTYQTEINYLKTWLTNRITWLDGQWGN